MMKRHTNRETVNPISWLSLPPLYGNTIWDTGRLPQGVAA